MKFKQIICIATSLLALVATTGWATEKDSNQKLPGCVPVTVTEMKGYRPVTVKRADGGHLFFKYLPDGRLRRIEHGGSSKTYYYQDPSQQPYMIRIAVKSADGKTSLRDSFSPKALRLVEVINKSNGKALASYLYNFQRRVAKLSPTNVVATASVISPEDEFGDEWGQEQYDIWLNDLTSYGVLTQDVPSFLVCETPITCGLCLAACHYITDNARQECNLYSGDDRLKCLVRSGRDEMICGMLCL